MAITDYSPKIKTLPTLNKALLTTALVGGAFATIGFDLFEQFFSPLMKSVASLYLGAKLAPVGLANQSLAVILVSKPKLFPALGTRCTCSLVC